MLFDTTVRERKRSRLWIGLPILALALAGCAYLLHRQGVDLVAALSSLRQTSEEAATTAKVKAAFALSESVSAFDIDVDTRGRTVTLTGSVPSEAVKKLALEIAGDTAGVERVQSALTVDPGALPDPEIARLGARIADLEIKTAVVDALRQSEILAGEPIEVLVEDRNVLLSGKLRAPEQKYQAELTAMMVRGVGGMQNRIEVLEPSARPRLNGTADERLARQVEFELYLSRAFNLDLVRVQSQSGRITLSGAVRSLSEKLLAERIAIDVKGVGDVVNDLKIAEGAAPPVSSSGSWRGASSPSSDGAPPPSQLSSGLPPRPVGSGLSGT